MIRNKLYMLIMLLCLLWQTNTEAQHYKYQASLYPVHADGFYQIRLLADVLGVCNANLSDIRILDEQQQQIPYLPKENEELHKQPAIYIDQPVGSYKQVDSPGYSLVSMQFAKAIPVEKIQLSVTYPKYYQRRVSLLMSEDTDKTFSEIATEKILSFGNTTIHTEMIKSRYLLLSIENNDNPPLHISSVSTGYTPRCIVAYLEKGKGYTLNFGNEYATLPNYDLSAFKDKIPDSIGQTGYTKTIETTGTVPLPKPTPAYWVWASLLVALIVMGYFTFRLIKDMKTKGM